VITEEQGTINLKRGEQRLHCQIHQKKRNGTQIKTGRPNRLRLGGLKKPALNSLGGSDLMARKHAMQGHI